ncbi:ABC transporter substrate-binding protein [Brevibacillus centrosporus]|uniref:Amino acid/amide ABC transporter substrate-binding protein, HAAT family n=1 Tax=Brevibacillus centrosporus TaxID=54910 RepID=A0A1I3XCP0_9BACL|nr:ABC transporter substrate-binding protein [Brevibacillus centrosporus]MED4910942.1 ABC transporter substrate-binding protein [Brevibacillus centrosporus]SFK17290.1 amino acid/amide ABC transporter substrate-binding protein, HAAT family [Brevibacillus centrosporus]
MVCKKRLGKSRIWISTLLTLVLLVLGACSNQTASSGEGEPIKIGAILSFSGNFAPLSESIKAGMELYFEQNGNKIGNRPVTVKYEDDEANPQVALRKYRQLVDSEKVDLLVGPISSSVVYALRDVIEKDKIVLIVANAAANDISWDKKSDYIYRVSISNWQDGTPGAAYIANNIGKKAYVLAPDYPAGHETIEAFKAAFVAAGGEIVKEAWPKLGNNDYATYLTDIQQTKPDLVFPFLAGTDAIRFVQQYEQFGLKGKIPLTGTQEFLDPLVTDPAGQAAEGIIGATMYTAALDNATNKAFVEAFTKKYGKTPNYFNVQGYDSAQVIAKAVEKAGSVKSEDLTKVLKDIAFSSPRGELAMDPMTHNLTLDMYLAKNVWKDGKIVQEIMGDAMKGLKIPETPPAKSK